jgi:CRISPR-associated protein Cmr5
MQTIQQRRAGFALDKILMAAKEKGIDKKEYKSHAAALPAMIHMNGLGQAAAFYKSKGGEHNRIYQLLSDWLTQTGQPYQGKKDLIADGIVKEDMHSYRLAQAESQAFMDWVVKIAKAYMVEGKS